jgi:hypothetical protein
VVTMPSATSCRRAVADSPRWRSVIGDTGRHLCLPAVWERRSGYWVRPSALRPTLGAIDDDPVEVEHCDGTVIIHANRAVTCSNLECDAASGGIGAVLNRHCRFVSCMTTLGRACPICGPPVR